MSVNNIVVLRPFSIPTNFFFFIHLSITVKFCTSGQSYIHTTGSTQTNKLPRHINFAISFVYCHSSNVNKPTDLYVLFVYISVYSNVVKSVRKPECKSESQQVTRHKQLRLFSGSVFSARKIRLRNTHSTKRRIVTMTTIYRKQAPQTRRSYNYMRVW